MGGKGERGRSRRSRIVRRRRSTSSLRTHRTVQENLGRQIFIYSRPTTVSLIWVWALRSFGIQALPWEPGSGHQGRDDGLCSQCHLPCIAMIAALFCIFSPFGRVRHPISSTNQLTNLSFHRHLSQFASDIEGIPSSVVVFPSFCSFFANTYSRAVGTVWPPARLFG